MNEAYCSATPRPPRGSTSPPPACGRAALARSSRGTRWAGRAAISSARPVGERHREGHRSPPAMEPIRVYSGLAIGRRRRDPRRPRRPRPGARGRLPARYLLVAGTTGSGWIDAGARRTPSSTSRAATRRSSACSTPTCRPGCPTWSTSPRRGRRAARSSTPSTSAGRAARRTTPPALRDRREPRVVRRRGRVQRRGDLRNRTSGTLFAGPPNFNTLFTGVPRAPGRRQPGGPPVYKGGRTVRFTNDADRGDPAGRASRGRAAASST